MQSLKTTKLAHHKRDVTLNQSYQLAKDLHGKLSARCPRADSQTFDIRHQLRREEKWSTLNFDLEQSQGINFREWSVLMK